MKRSVLLHLISYGCVVVVMVLLSVECFAQTPDLRLNQKEYFEAPGLNVMAFQDIYPDGHQGGVSVIQNGVRVATNGDIRLDPVPGQWQPMPKQDQRVVDSAANTITTTLSYPDPTKNRTGFNPIDYPDLNFSYKVVVHGEGQSVRVTVDLDKPIPEKFVGKVGFNFELFPNDLFGKTWFLGDTSGIFPRQPNGPESQDENGEIQPVPLATGARLSIAPETDAQRMIIESKTGNLQLLDARSKRNNGWFVVRSLIPAGATKHAIEWIITPTAVPGWKYQPVVHVSQVGYHPAQKKLAVIELARDDTGTEPARLLRVNPDGPTQVVLSETPKAWGNFLRYKYVTLDFTKTTAPGMYEVAYRETTSQPFRIAADVYQRGVWQPVLEYFLPVQMCHMRVEQQYRTWHGACHLDDARMSQVNHNHFDGYEQGPSTLTRYQPGETVPGLNRGGWHDAGDVDLRIESQADEVSILASAYETFDLDYDDTTVDENSLRTQIHIPDGKADVLQQIEHGVLTILGGYRATGRVYRGIQEATLQQYVLLGDPVNATDGLFYNAKMKPVERAGTESGTPDDRWLFTEQNPEHEYKAIASLAAAGRVLRASNPALATECLAAAEALWNAESDAAKDFDERMIAAAQLFRSTGNDRYRQAILSNAQHIVADSGRIAWAIAPITPQLANDAFTRDLREAVRKDFAGVARKQSTDSPFGVPYTPYIWGAGWDIERFGVEQFYLHQAFPDIVSADYLLNALNFMLGVHPGSNTASFASGVGARSATIAYGFNRADSSYIPGGVVSGTALIRPDFPELKDFGFLWQQMEYVLGGGSSNFMFLTLAADDVLNGHPQAFPPLAPPVRIPDREP
ncbi:glycoside hydrolase family 9 protein [Occallatibacter riparius]|uniref:Glycoside hydrolase family 9 protein n=1 Tax=Occallatibacter riparius TaxID=1002689 RepID=A0A9J7BXM2_9BACT|nr:glycoside hydrolase family 9 protein [Occallatibacter riparius]UWZ85957.1 glycoside hydrolase family 9 protein [Occallatibacter riparius]